MPKFFNDWGDTDRAHAVDTTWTDIDITSLVGADAGSVEMVFGVAHNTSAGELEFGVRENGSSDTTLKADTQLDSSCFFVAGVDSDDIFECYLEDASEFNVYVLGYALTSEAEWLATPVELTSGISASTWTECDLSSHFTGTATLGIFALVSSASRQMGVRGADDTRDLREQNHDGISFAVAPLNSEKCDVYTDDTSSGKIYLVGALTANFTELDTYDYDDHGTTGSYVDNDLSAVIGAASKAIVCQIHDGTTIDLVGNNAIRPNGETFDVYAAEAYFVMPVIMPISSDRIIEYKRDSIYSDMYTLGYLTEPSSGGGGGGAVYFYSQQ